MASLDSMTLLLPLRSSAQSTGEDTFPLFALEASPALCSYSNRPPPAAQPRNKLYIEDPLGSAPAHVPAWGSRRGEPAAPLPRVPAS